MIHIAILGFGVVGSGTAKVITDNYKRVCEKINDEINIKYILDLRDFPDHPLGGRVIKDFNVILNDPEISIVVEMMGGVHPAYDFTLAALKAGKNVVTSNKAVVADHGVELLRIAAENKVRYLFEASVGGGIPIIRPMNTSLCGDDVLAVSGILNGTTNYILTKMRDTGKDFPELLAEAQKKGYAEADPTADIEGHDACRKICILAAIAFGKLVKWTDVPMKGISSVTPEHFAEAEKKGCAIKLIARAEKLENGKVYMNVAPYMINKSNPLANVDDVFNGILVSAKDTGDVMFYGRGAGSLPTAGAVLSDIIDIAANIGAQPAQILWEDADASFLETKLTESGKEAEAAEFGTPIV